MSKAATYQCPNCSGVLAFDVASGRLACGHCGSTFEESEIAAPIPLNDEAPEARETAHVTTVEGFLERASWTINANGAVNAIVYSCPSCGAEVAADQSVVSTSCPYCGNNMLVSGTATRDNIPSKVLPFSVSKDQAIANMKAYFQGKRYLSRQFHASLEHLQGVYVPYHLYDMRVEGWANYVAYDRVREGEGEYTDWYYAVKRAGHASFKRVPVDGSSKMPDGHMDAIAPFSLDDMRDFDTGYVAGYLMEVPDEDAETCRPRAEQRVRTSFEEGLRADACKGDHIDGVEKVMAHETRVSEQSASLCALPAWLMHCTWNGEDMLFAVNGETGKCVGDLPIDPARRRTTMLITALITALVIAAFGFWAYGDNTSGLPAYIGGAIPFTAFICWLIDLHFRNQMRSAVEAEDAAMSYSGEGLVVTSRWQSDDCFRKAEKAEALLAQDG